MSKFKAKTMLKCFSDIGDIVHFEFAPEESTVNQTFYVEVLKRHIDTMKKKQVEVWRNHSLFLQHDKRRHVLRFECRSFQQEKASLPSTIRRTLLT
jgi:hypothetical protein